jgi:membrane associated rhomboid family serine protease
MEETDLATATLTGSPIQTSPSFNPMIGPSSYVLINMGARWVPCMRNQDGIQNNNGPVLFPCPNTTDTTATCSLSELCGMSGVPNPDPPQSLDHNPQPNQWYRFITPIFLHAGLIHIGFNMLLQMTLGRDMEREIGSIRFFLIYFAAGIFGFVFGGNFAPPGIAPVGASGSLFGIFALSLLSLLYTWKERRKPGKDLAFIILDIVISFALGLLPGFDNFSHIGGFLMGLVAGICVLHSPNSLRKRTHQDHPPYTPMSPGDGRSRTEVMARGEGMRGFIKNPVGFFKGRVAWWWAWWLVRVGALLTILIVFIVLLNNFYVYRTECSWCKYLSCLVSLTIPHGNI